MLFCNIWDILNLFGSSLNVNGFLSNMSPPYTMTPSPRFSPKHTSSFCPYWNIITLSTWCGNIALKHTTSVLASMYDLTERHQIFNLISVINIIQIYLPDVLHPVALSMYTKFKWPLDKRVDCFVQGIHSEVSSHRHFIQQNWKLKDPLSAHINGQKSKTSKQNYRHEILVKRSLYGLLFSLYFTFSDIDIKGNSQYGRRLHLQPNPSHYANYILHPKGLKAHSHQVTPLRWRPKKGMQPILSFTLPLKNMKGAARQWRCSRLV